MSSDLGIELCDDEDAVNMTKVEDESIFVWVLYQTTSLGDQCKFFGLLTYVFKTMSSRFWFCEDEKGLEPSINHERHSISSENET